MVYDREMCVFFIDVCDSLTCADNTSNGSGVAGCVCEGSMRTLSQSGLNPTAFNVIGPGVAVAKAVFAVSGNLMGFSTVQLFAHH